MAATTPTPAETQRSAQPQAPQPIFEKMPLHPAQGMQFFPLAPGQQQPPLLQPPGPEDEELPFSRKWHIAKLALGTASVVTSIIIWALCIVLLAKYSNYDFNQYSDNFQIIFEAAFALSTAGIALLWQASEFCTIWSSKKPNHRGIHPGAHVGVHLIIWLAAVTIVGFLATFVAWDVGNLADIRNGTGNSYYSSYTSYSNADINSYATMLRLEEAVLAFLAILMVLHFVLFVRACVETHQFNSWLPQPRTIYVQVPMMGGGQQVPLPRQQLLGYYAYQPLPGQALPFVTPQQQQGQQQTQQQTQGAPVSPQQAHMYGYYAPAPGSQPADGRMSTVSATSAAPVGAHGSPAPVSPVASSHRQ